MDQPATIITVRGSSRAESRPDECTVRFTIANDGPERAPVQTAVSTQLAAVSALISGMRSDAGGPVSNWSADRVSVTAQRPWTSDGSQAALVHRASVSGAATLDDIDAVAGLVDELATHDLVTIDGLEWALADSHLATVRADVRARAVADARGAAEVLAAAVGLSSVTVLALADPGMLDGSPGPDPMPRFEKAMAMSMDSGGGLSLRPEPIVIEAAVDARFSARAADDQ